MGEGSAGGLGAGALPTGTVTFLFTDLEGSTRLLEAHPDAYREAVARHHALLREAVEARGGVVFETVGDAVYAAFRRPTDAVRAALAGQRALRAHDWGAAPLRARMGLHHGEVDLQGAHYFGAPLYRCARLTATAHGGQTVLSAAVAEVVRDALPVGAGLRDLGAHRLKASTSRSGSSSWWPRTSRPCSRPCARWTPCRTTCPGSRPASSGARGRWRRCERHWRGDRAISPRCTGGATGSARLAAA